MLGTLEHCQGLCADTQGTGTGCVKDKLVLQGMWCPAPCWDLHFPSSTGTSSRTPMGASQELPALGSKPHATQVSLLSPLKA